MGKEISDVEFMYYCIATFSLFYQLDYAEGFSLTSEKCEFVSEEYIVNMFPHHREVSITTEPYIEDGHTSSCLVKVVITKKNKM